MLKAEYRQLRKGGVRELCQSAAQSESVLVQVYGLALTKAGKLSLNVSDGTHSVKAVIKDSSVLAPNQNQFSIIRVTNHIVADSGRKLAIGQFEFVCQYSKMIGEPKPFDIESINNPEEVRESTLEAGCILTKNSKIFQVKEEQKREARTAEKRNQLVRKEEHKVDKLRLPLPQPKPLSGTLKDFETIKGLFVGLRGWHLLCRIVKIDHQQFKKRDGKEVRVLNIELMDRSQVKISGACFGEAADKFKDELRLGGVYKISEGVIQNQNYNNSKNEKLSPFRLIFNVNSQFEEVSDVKIIAKPEDAAITLGNLLYKGTLDQQFDVIGVLVQIQETKDILKGDKNLRKCNWILADPTVQKRIQVVIWNDKIKVDYSLIGHTVILSRFTLHNYNGSLTLSSKFRSAIQLANQHEYQQQESRVMDEYKNYQQVSDRKFSTEEGNSIVCKSLKELDHLIYSLPGGQSIRSDLNLWLNRMMMKKWYYDGCPHCQKAAERNMSCNNCSKFVQETVPHFIMGVQMSDAFGSLWTTAYDEQAKKMFVQQEGVIHKLLKYDQNQLRDVAQNYLYQEFRARVYSKKDNEGRIRHNLGRLEVWTPEKIAAENLGRIRELLGA